MIERLPPLLVIVAFLLHLLGARRLRRAGESADRRGHLEALAFYAAVAVMLSAFAGPIYDLAYKLFWVHMIQHLILLTVAPPLIVLGRPWRPMWNAVPHSWQRAFASLLVGRAVLKPIRAGARALAGPTGAWLLFNAGVVVWHLPGPYDLTLRNIYVHIVEHAMFLLFGILFWAQVIGLAPASGKLSYARRIVYVGATMWTNVALSIVLAFAQHPFYAPYAQLTHRPGGISALADQQIGAGIMWTAGDMPFAAAIAVLVQRIFAEHELKTSLLLETTIRRMSDGDQPEAESGDVETKRM